MDTLLANPAFRTYAFCSAILVLKMVYSAVYTGTRRSKTQGFINPESFVFMESATVVAIVVLGGMGSILGAFWGGMTIGLVQQLSTLVLPTQLQNTAIFVVFLLIIFLRPQGFFGRVVERT